MKTILLFATLTLSAITGMSQSEWIACVPPVSIDYQAVFMPQPNKVLIGGTGGTLLMSTDLGTSFDIIPVESNLDISAIQFTSQQDGFMLQESEFYRSADGGYTWTFVSEIPGNTRNFYFVNNNTGYAACDNGEAFITNDGGTTWALLATGINERLLTVNFKNTNEGMFGGRNGASLHTTDQGQSFTLGMIPTNGDINALQFAGNTSVFSCGDAGEVMHSSDGGLTWNPQVTPDDNNDLVAMHFTGNQTGWIAGDAGTIIHTIDGGSTWMTDITNTGNDMLGIHLYNSSQGIAVGTNGTVLRFGDLATAVYEVPASTEISLKVFPNPANGDFTVSFDETHTNGKLSILDISGKEVFRSTLPDGHATLNSKDIGLNPGIYFCRILSDDKVEVMRLVVN